MTLSVSVTDSLSFSDCVGPTTNRAHKAVKRFFPRRFDDDRIVMPHFSTPERERGP